MLLIYIKVFYYTAYPAEGTRDYSLDGKHKFLTFLKKGLGFVVRKKELKRISILTANGESIEEKGNMDVEMTIDVMHHLAKYQTAVFFTGDSDFLALVAYLRHHRKKVFVFSSKTSSAIRKRVKIKATLREEGCSWMLYPFSYG